MIPSNRWFPTSLSDRATWCKNFSVQFPIFGASLGFTANEISDTHDDLDVIISMPSVVEQITAYADSVRKYRIAVTENPDNTLQDVYPTFPAIPAPALVHNGIFRRLSDTRDRILLSPNYTETIGAQLGILTDNPPVPAEIKPVIKVTAQFNGYRFDAVTSKQGMQAFKVLIRRMDSEAWQEAAFGTTSPLTVTVTPHTAGQAERIQVCVQLIDKNQPVGVPSDVVYVTINP